MDATEYSQLAARVEKADEKSQKIKDAQNTEEQIEDAVGHISRLANNYSEVQQRAAELAFYVDVLEEVFDGNRPENAKTEIEKAYKKVDLDDQEVLSIAKENSYPELSQRLSDGSTHLKQACDMVRDKIEEEYVDPKKDELETAKELNDIIGSNSDEFRNQIRKMQNFLERDIWDTSKLVPTLASRWERMQEEWEEHSDKQSWDQFQEANGLASSTISELKQFTTSDVVLLSDLSSKTLEEIKKVPELESALEVKLRG